MTALVDNGCWSLFEEENTAGNILSGVERQA